MPKKPTDPTKKNDALSFVEKVVSWPFKVLVYALFYFFGYLLLKNKYSKKYWENRREWRKTMRRLRSRVQNDIIISAILPVLEKQGFQKLPYPCWWGWSNQGGGGYEYELARLKGEKLQTLNLQTSYGRSCIIFSFGSYITKPNLASISDLAEYGSEIFFKAKPYSPKLYPRYQFIAYKIRLCRSEKKLIKKLPR